MSASGDLFDAPPPVPSGKAPASDAERFAWLRLWRARGVGPSVFLQLIQRAPDIHAAIELAREFGVRRGRDIAIPEDTEVEAELDAGAAAGAELLCLGAPGYPELLAQIDSPPAALWRLGAVRTFPERAVALVGSRNASALGQRFAERLARELAEAGWAVASGFARGVDAAAHRGALAAEGGVTLAAVAGGVDIVYPPENAELHPQLVERGALVSEMPIGLQPQSRHFPRRNRLISGLSKAVVVIEGAARSGALITARAALAQGRDAMAAPGHPWDPRAEGSNQMIRDGAALIRGAEDVIEALETGGHWRGPISDPPPRRAEEPPAATPEPAPQAEVEAEPAAINAVLALLSPSPVAIDEVIRASGLSAAEVSQALLELELAGRVERRAGAMVSLAPS